MKIDARIFRSNFLRQDGSVECVEDATSLIRGVDSRPDGVSVVNSKDSQGEANSTSTIGSSIIMFNSLTIPPQSGV